MSNLCLIVVALLLGIVIYRLFYTLVKPVRVVVACVSLVTFIVIGQNLETIGHVWNSAHDLHVSFLSQKRAGNVSSPVEQPVPVTDVALQSIMREDRNFLDEFTRTESQTGQSPRVPAPVQVPGIAKELADNTLRVKRAELVPHRETVKRAQLVTQNEVSKHAELVRSGQR
jgi:hypothetical protein